MIFPAGANAINVRVSDSRVVLEGDVHALNELRAAEQAAWSVPGVTIVENHLHVG
ncbi:BON domain-containing protein [Rhizobium sp. BK313]|uniref:BON domain-containing protein n=1 Tax=Rhizobium sp. BK313 TaxID=2587081 RepID=UPI001AEE02A0|nr:BON domain-containing protein [Rhizobium sp. BK313]